MRKALFLAQRAVFEFDMSAEAETLKKAILYVQGKRRNF